MVYYTEKWRLALF